MRAIGGARSGAIHSFWGTLLGLQARIAVSRSPAPDDAAAPAATDDAAAAPAEPATATDDATGASPEITVGDATTLPAEVRRKLKFGARRLSEDAEVRRKLKFGARRLSEDN